MKEIENVSIGGFAFALEKDASAAVERYLNGLEAHYLNQEGGKEIMEGIEERMAELLYEKCGRGGVVTLDMVRGVIDILGRPERIEADDPDPDPAQGSPEASPTQEKPRRKLYRDMENKRIGDLAQRYGVAMAVHMAETPVSALACVHSAAATENFYVLENHSVDVPWWNDITIGQEKPLVQDGFITVPDRPGLGVEDYNDEVIREHLHPDYPELWAETCRWDDVYSHDRLWS